MPEEASLVITNSGIPNAVPEPGFIAFGELTLNWADSIIYFKNKEGAIQQISVGGLTPIQLTERLPVNEGPWFTFPFPGTPANTAYIPVKKADGDLPRLKIGLIADPGPNYVLIEDDVDITVGVVAGTTMNEIIALIRNDEDANALIRIFNSPGSDGTGVVTGSLPLVAAASFNNVNNKIGDRAEYVGQVLFVDHSDTVVGFQQISEWVAATINPTVWIPRTPGIIWNRDTSLWEIQYSQDGIFQSSVLPDQI
jgi:hypothetical protein